MLSTGKTVHPHTQGKYKESISCWIASPGSSPHAGEIRHCWHGGHDAARFIPTRRGNTHPPGQCSIDRPVHPHTRGKYVDVERACSNIFGSSPHAGEIPVQGILAYTRFRFIPTRGGNTLMHNVPQVNELQLCQRATEPNQPFFANLFILFIWALIATHCAINTSTCAINTST